MKHTIAKYLLAGTLLLVIGACKKNNLAVDVDEIEVPEAARFVLRPAIPTTAPGNHYGFFILENPAPGSTFKIPVGLTTVSNSDRKVKFTYSSLRAVAGTQYNAPAEITIKAGSTIDTLTIQGLFAGYPTGRKDTLKIKIASDGTGVPSIKYQDSLMLVMQKYCNVVLANIGGNYTRTYENGTYGPYLSTVTNVTSTGATTATGTITNIYDSGISATATFDWTNPAAFTVTVASQQTQYTSGGLPLFVRTVAGTNTFSSCDNTITLSLQLYTTAGQYDAWVMTMAK